MRRVAFKMKILVGKKEEYKKRHDEIWPELTHLLTESGISDYSIFLDTQSNILFGTYKLAENNSVDDLPHQPIMKKWWAHMKDIMETNEDNSPVSVLMEEVFYMQ